VDEIRKATSRPFAVNLWVSDGDPGGLDVTAEAFERGWKLFEPYFTECGISRPAMPERAGERYAEHVEALLAAEPPAMSFVFGAPSPKLVEECRRKGIVTIGTATTIAEAQALEAAGVEIIVATGMEAGGHRPSFIESAEDSLTGTFALVQLVAARVKAPVIAAGGIVDAKGVRAALALGAAGAQVGTAFLACEESGASAAHREALFSPAAQRTRLTRAFTGRLARGIENRWVREMKDRARELSPFPLQSWFLSHLRAATAGRTDLVSLWSGQIAPNLQHRSAAALMDALAGGL
jgi:nitronate monooxygenase